jgi:hypothetical protein
MKKVSRKRLKLEKLSNENQRLKSDKKLITKTLRKNRTFREREK